LCQDESPDTGLKNSHKDGGQESPDTRGHGIETELCSFFSWFPPVFFCLAAIEIQREMRQNAWILTEAAKRIAETDSLKDE
jgi:hypothetical protein